jgi:hypothetical protein
VEEAVKPADEKMLDDATKVFEALEALPSDVMRARVLLSAIAYYVPDAFTSKQMGALLKQANEPIA